MPLKRENRRRQITLNVSPYVYDVDAVALSLINQFKADEAAPEITKLDEYKLSLTFRETDELTYEVACQKILWNQYVQNIEQKNVTNNIELLKKLVDPYFDSPVVANVNENNIIIATNKISHESWYSAPNDSYVHQISDPNVHVRISEEDRDKEYYDEPPELEALLGHLIGVHKYPKEEIKKILDRSGDIDFQFNDLDIEHLWEHRCQHSHPKDAKGSTSIDHTHGDGSIYSMSKLIPRGIPGTSNHEITETSDYE